MVSNLGEKFKYSKKYEYMNKMSKTSKYYTQKDGGYLDMRTKLFNYLQTLDCIHFGNIAKATGLKQTTVSTWYFKWIEQGLLKPLPKCSWAAPKPKKKTPEEIHQILRNRGLKQAPLLRAVKFWKHGELIPRMEKFAKKNLKEIEDKQYKIDISLKNFCKTWLKPKKLKHIVKNFNREAFERGRATLRNKYLSGELKIWCEGKKRPEFTGSNNPNFKGYPRKKKMREIGQSKHIHRTIAKRKYGFLLEGYDVHHIDENPLNNNPNNLILISREAHTKWHQIQNRTT